MNPIGLINSKIIYDNKNQFENGFKNEENYEELDGF